MQHIGLYFFFIINGHVMSLTLISLRIATFSLMDYIKKKCTVCQF